MGTARAGRHRGAEQTGAASTDPPAARRPRHAAPETTISPPARQRHRPGPWIAGVSFVLAAGLLLAGCVALLVPQMTEPPAAAAQDMGSSSVAVPASSVGVRPDRTRQDGTASARPGTPPGDPSAASPTGAPPSAGGNTAGWVAGSPVRTRPGSAAADTDEAMPSSTAVAGAGEALTSAAGVTTEPSTSAAPETSAPETTAATSSSTPSSSSAPPETTTPPATSPSSSSSTVGSSAETSEPSTSSPPATTTASSTTEPSPTSSGAGGRSIAR
ncbi:MAG: hypothetical protein JWR66_4207 [Modestobacter sp.]|nr:hypothetical protein [Modestobacter sp.]